MRFDPFSRQLLTLDFTGSNAAVSERIVTVCVCSFLMSAPTVTTLSVMPPVAAFSTTKVIVISKSFTRKHRDEVGLGLALLCLDQALPDRKDQIGDINCILSGS